MNKFSAGPYVSNKLGELTWIEVKKLLDKGLDTVILPVGTVEAHGRHLPLSADIIVPEYLSKELANKLNALLAPSVNYGVTKSLLSFPGSQTLSEGTFRDYLKDLFISFGKSGFNNIIVINGHGGNQSAIRSAAEDAYSRSRVRVIEIDWWTFTQEISEKHFGLKSGHALASETAAVLVAGGPNLVKKKLFSAKDTVTLEDGLWMIPLTGAQIGTGSDIPDFNVKKAKAFMRDVEAKIHLTISRILLQARKAPL
jgi:creatinine amidohydrolase